MKAKRHKRLKLIFIAGPFKGRIKQPSAMMIERNVRMAEALSLRVWKLGAIPICMHTMNRFFFGELGEEDDIPNAAHRIIDVCDAVITSWGWEFSEGAEDEVQYAHKEGKPVFHSDKDLRCWLEDTKRD